MRLCETDGMPSSPLSTPCAFFFVFPLVIPILDNGSTPQPTLAMWVCTQFQSYSSQGCEIPRSTEQERRKEHEAEWDLAFFYKTRASALLSEWIFKMPPGPFTIISRLIKQPLRCECAVLSVLSCSGMLFSRAWISESPPLSNLASIYSLFSLWCVAALSHTP